MKKYIYLSVLSLAMTFWASCSNQSTKSPDSDSEFHNSLTAADTVQMLKLADDCMELLKDRKIDEALSMLCEYDDSTGTVSPLSEETKAIYKKRFSLFPVIRYYQVAFNFVEEGLNDVKYEVEFGDADPKTGKAPRTTFMFNPVKVDSQWYISMKRSDQSVRHNLQ